MSLLCGKSGLPANAGNPLFPCNMTTFYNLAFNIVDNIRYEPIVRYTF